MYAANENQQQNIVPRTDFK